MKSALPVYRMGDKDDLIALCARGWGIGDTALAIAQTDKIDPST
ncbi:MULTISPECIES: hypothetical protein [unclassified Roseofilum]|nr:MULTISPECIES: hypothetical protein [unclassified Roseofilum]